MNDPRDPRFMAWLVWDGDINLRVYLTHLDSSGGQEVWKYKYVNALACSCFSDRPEHQHAWTDWLRIGIVRPLPSALWNDSFSFKMNQYAARLEKGTAILEDIGIELMEFLEVDSSYE